jgi:hypothetical protein
MRQLSHVNEWPCDFVACLHCRRTSAHLGFRDPMTSSGGDKMRVIRLSTVKRRKSDGIFEAGGTTLAIAIHGERPPRRKHERVTRSFSIGHSLFSDALPGL